jgi:hypothetical protein
MLVAKDNTSFNFEDFKNQAIADMKAGKALVGKDGIFTPLMKDTTLKIKHNFEKEFVFSTHQRHYEAAFA